CASPVVMFISMTRNRFDVW
nr:immunoglobulin heavy chain junction region [Macaca mulatta]MOW18990.1 immunoglobulin heavy chain junction region [Macaca mulatta]MOW19230.1 immunoglobulin heavy chain junction region [Macaca mulatta]MOW19663.1 immunoglobulin heavy chain junction region [Macaca mulatta]MOW19733.1 immunoglobulin heavy chain junction region [Macaca mulatta]